VWTAEANSFWVWQKPQSFWGRQHFRLQTSGDLPCQRRGLPTQEGFTTASGGATLGSRIPPRQLCQGESMNYRSYYTDSGTSTVSGLHLLPGGRSEQQISVHLPCKRRACLQSALITETQERSSLPGLLIEANRIIRGTSSNQRQL
jgi:hypothetical protein